MAKFLCWNNSLRQQTMTVSSRPRFMTVFSPSIMSSWYLNFALMGTSMILLPRRDHFPKRMHSKSHINLPKDCSSFPKEKLYTEILNRITYSLRRMEVILFIKLEILGLLSKNKSMKKLSELLFLCHQNYSGKNHMGQK